MRSLTDGHPVPADAIRNPGGWRGRSVDLQWIDEVAEFNVVGRVTRCMQPCCHPVSPPAIEAATMQRIVQAASEHPQFEAPHRRVSISAAPAGTDPRDDRQFTRIDEATYATTITRRMDHIAEGLTSELLSNIPGVRFAWAPAGRIGR